MSMMEIPVEEKDCHGNEENDENGDGNGPSGDSSLALATAGWVILH